MLDIHTASFAYLPLQTIAYSHPRFRQNRDWSYRQALANSILKASLKNYTALRIKWPQSLNANHDKNGRVIIQPAPPHFYKLSVVNDSDIRPQSIGATWYPSLPSFGATDAAPDVADNVILHFHGGSYVLGDGKPPSTQFVADTLLDKTPCNYMLCAQYRLACRPNNRFPAQLQDAISAYAFMLHELKVPAVRIVLSGDSSGGHLVLALLRYITEFNDDTVLPPPRCALLWSPWCDVPAAQTPQLWKQSENYTTEFIPSSFPQWGARSVLSGLQISDAVQKYLVPVRHPFMLQTPVLIVTGDKEVLYDEHRALAATLAQFPGNEQVVKLTVSMGTPHDVLMIAWLLGFEKEARDCAEVAGSFISLAKRPADI